MVRYDAPIRKQSLICARETMYMINKPLGVAGAQGCNVIVNHPEHDVLHNTSPPPVILYRGLDKLLAPFTG